MDYKYVVKDPDFTSLSGRIVKFQIYDLCNDRCFAGASIANPYRSNFGREN